MTTEKISLRHGLAALIVTRDHFITEPPESRDPDPPAPHCHRQAPRQPGNDPMPKPQQPERNTAA